MQSLSNRNMVWLLRECARHDNAFCEECPYRSLRNDIPNCRSTMMYEAARRIRKLDREVSLIDGKESVADAERFRLGLG